MQHFDATGLAVLLVLPFLAVFYWRPRRLPVRRVAGVFLWMAPQQTRSGQPRQATGRTWPVTCDIVIVAILALLACGIFGTTNEPSEGVGVWRSTTGRLILCVACMALLMANWRAGKDQ